MKNEMKSKVGFFRTKKIPKKSKSSMICITVLYYFCRQVEIEVEVEVEVEGSTK
jgi:hypothetical protein